MDVFGPTEDVLLNESRGYAILALKRFDAELTHHRYVVQRRAVLSIGRGVRPAAAFHCPEHAKRADSFASEDIESPPVFAVADSTLLHGPFYEHPLLADSSLSRAWRDLLVRLAVYHRSAGDPPLRCPEAIGISRALGTAALGIVSVQSCERGIAKGLLVNGAGVAAWLAAGVDPLMPECGSGVIRFALLDGATGDVLWADQRVTRNLTFDSLKFRVPEMISEMP